MTADPDRTTAKTGATARLSSKPRRMTASTPARVIPHAARSRERGCAAASAFNNPAGSATNSHATRTGKKVVAIREPPASRLSCVAKPRSVNNPTVMRSPTHNTMFFRVNTCIALYCIISGFCKLGGDRPVAGLMPPNHQCLEITWTDEVSEDIIRKRCTSQIQRGAEEYDSHRCDRRAVGR